MNEKFNDFIKLPAGIDIHVHFREPGFEYKETMETGMKAANNGGIYTVVDMPNTKPVTDNMNSFKEKKELAGKYKGIIVASGITNQSVNSGELIPLAKQSRIVKIFMANSTGNLGIDRENLMKSLTEINELKNEEQPLIMIHAEHPDYIKPRTTTSNELDVRPLNAEIKAIENIIEFSKMFNNLHLHVTHVSSSESAHILMNQNKISFDVLHKYLCFNEGLVNKFGNKAKMNPPLRSQKDQEELYNIFLNEKIKYISSDHAPHTLKDKESLIAGAPGVQELYPFLIDLYLKDEIKKNYMVDLIYNNPKKLLLEHNLSIQETDITVDPNSIWKLTKDQIKSKCGWSLWENIEFKGKIINL